MAKKAEEQTPSEPKVIRCPACESSISSDGRELHEKSKRLSDYQEASEGMAEVGTALEDAEKLIAQLKEENKSLKEKGKVHVLETPKENPDAELESQD